MASWIMFGVLLILLETYYVSGICEEYYFDADTKNVSLTFKFVWETNETKYVRCLHDNKIIGECYKISNFECPLEPTSIGVYSMSTYVDLPVVNVTIKTFGCATSGNYSCFKYPGTPNITKCAKDSSTWHPITTSDTGDSTEICKTARIAIGAIGAFFLILIPILLLVLDRWTEQLFNDCCTKTRCWTISSLVLGVCIVGMAMGIVDFTTPCEEEWSELNYFAIVFGSVGDALLLVTCIATIMIELWSIRTSTKDLHYGLVYSHITDFGKIYAKPASNQLSGDLRRSYEDKLIKRFLLVIPNKCELQLVIPDKCEQTLPTSENLTSSTTSTLKKITLEYVKEVNIDKLKLYKLTMEKETNVFEEEYYVFAEVPTVLNVTYNLSKTLRGWTIAGVVMQKFQLLYKRVLSSCECDNNVQFVTCKGNDDIAWALFEAARALFNAAKKENASQMAPEQKNKNTNKKATSSTSDEAGVSWPMAPFKDCQVTPVDAIPTGDIIHDLARNYVENYLMKQISLVVSALKSEEKIHKDHKKKMIIVWVSTCNTDLSLKDLVEKCFKTSDPGLKILDPSGQESSELNRVMFQHRDAAKEKEEFIWAEYCTYMQRINMMKITSAEKHAHGKRFKEAFYKIISDNSIKQHLTDIEVKLIYYDVTPEDIIPTGDIIPGLAWDYVCNHLMNQKSPACTAFSASESKTETHKGCYKKMIIVWVSTCNTKQSLMMDLVNERFKPSDPRLKIVVDPTYQEHSNGVMFQHQDATKGFIWAEYCTSMQCINMMKNTSAEKHAHGTRFKEAFDEIMSKTSIKQHFTQKKIKVSLIYFDDRSFDEILTDDTKDLLPEVVSAPISS